MNGPGERFVRLDGRALHVRAEGSGPVCVLSAGLGMAWFDWEPVVPLLAPHRTVVRFDRPGYGLSAPGRAAPTAAGEADRIARLLTALGLPGRCTVVGHSLAGFHAEAFARLYPDRTAGLVLVDASAEPCPRPRPAPAARDLAARAAAATAGALALPYLLGPPGRRLVAALSTVGRTAPAPAALVRRSYRPTRALRAALRENAGYLDVAAELAALRTHAPLPAVPVTVLAADRGRGTRAAARWLTRQRELADLLGAAFRVAAPAGHLVMYDRPDLVARAVLDGS
ncbi:alpha/beta hydrolase [Kitasatospora sp. MMS16-BH015]|uniref:alpha/beta fold hydrolase n=1 Tax=Kitasatospora sp. MMS16-BH015 TaxID=2018025 RepID=UPI000CA25033|nr:alpha/beta hydrolase [Kitasatospora sp. MMS16-BH015]AUG77385.1 alpha/beta hydrolase [Kitasatospora sp. MMS16-BH015]